MPLRNWNDRFYGEFDDLKELVKRSGNELIFRCPYCVELTDKPDYKGKFYYNEINSRGMCFRCNTTIISNGLRSVDLIRQQLDKVPDTIRYDLQAFNLTGWTWRTFDYADEQQDWMVKKRNINIETLDRFNILSCSSPNLGIIFCNKIWQEDGEYHTDFFQVRQIEAFPKYVNMKDVVKPLSWIDHVTQKHLLIAEGFISGLAAWQHLEGSHDPLILEGKTMSKIQLEQLKELCYEKPIQSIHVVVDGGYFENGLKIARKLEKELIGGTDVFVTNLPFKKDPNDLDKGQFLKAFYENSYSYSRFSEGSIREKAYGKRRKVQ